MCTKRIIDLLLSSAALVFMIPLMLVLALIIKLSSPGPAVYSQWRIGRYGKPFLIYKFRSMVHNADQLGSSVVAAGDQRITKFGKFLRKAKLDELPQLWNVIKGDLSLVGPRPDVPEIIEEYTPEMRKTLLIRPGVTSLASFLLRDEQDLLTVAHDPEIAYKEILVPAKVKLNMEHLRSNSLLFDLSILIKTARCLLVGGRSMQEIESVKAIRSEILKQNKQLAGPG